ncbi:protein translocase subunit SecF [Candidatus Avelusimicrobium sp.]|uniref:protein translocase subunit SecF n=1 Tax=Candidatus Avelusimicrobium sp. TaxID=3048833 RepID=UPI003F7FEFCD
MMHLLPKTNIDFLKFRKVYFTLFALLLLGGVICFFTKGFNMGIDFTGGTMVQVKFNAPVEMADIRAALAQTGANSELQSFGDHSFAISEKSTSDEVGVVQARIEKALDTLKVPYSVLQTNSVGPAVGENMTERALWSVLLSLVFIIIYVAFRFSNILWGVSGVVALFHDLFVMAVAFSLTQREIDLVVVAAFLTVAGFSINDTIVIFDRMRENFRLHPKMDFGQIINLSINETLSRTIITTLTVLFALVVLYFFGGEVINSFAFAMLVGCIAGVYSTIALTTPLVYAWNNGENNDGSDLKKSAAKPATKAEVEAFVKEQKLAKTITKIKRTRRSKK